ncbi:MAG: aldose 1-epimerase [Acidimicrobiia bacterium]|nr:aldose 1-epimerase [Acidimicrobiia bacterium]
MNLTTSTANVCIDPGSGGRIASLEVDGVELLAPRQGGDWLTWGCYPMVPWAGRVRDGRFEFDSQKYQLELDLPPHAIHGVGYRASWEATGLETLHLNLEGLWPFGGRVEQRFEVMDQSLVVTMSVQAAQRMPAMAGWHPCFRRQLSRGGQAELSFNGGYMWQRDDAGIPTGERVPVTPGPWDDCFGDVAEPPEVRWPGFGSIRLESNMTTRVVYDEEPDLVCLEPQSDAPDSFNRDPAILGPGETLDMWMKISWDHEG